MKSAADTLRREAGVREVAARGRSVDVLRFPLLAVAYLGAWLLLSEASSAFWFLPAGLRFAVLWLTPRRRWGWFAAADIGAILALAALDHGFSSWIGFGLATFVPWCSQALVIALIRPGGVYAAPESPARMSSTLTAMLLGAALTALAQSGMRVLEGDAAPAQWLASGVIHIIGNYLGMLTLAPIAFQLLQPRAQGQERRGMVVELGLMFLPLLALFAILLSWRTPESIYAGILALVPMMLMAFRHGWRGAAWALAITSVAMHLFRLGIEAPLPGEVLHLFLAIVGSVAMLLGSATGSLRRVNAALIERNRQEMQANARLAEQTDALRDLSRRLVRAREDEQGRLAHELHDEVGQSVTALGTRLRLLMRHSDDPELLAALNSQRELVQRIQVSIREVLQGLRPAVLDRFGLEAALREGPLQRLLEDAAVEYEFGVSGPIDRLGTDCGSAIYRICQEAATNCVRHAQARAFRLRVDVAPAWAGDLEVHLRIEDDGRGFDPAAVDATSLSGGLRGIRDRVMALAGEYRCESGPGGTRHTVWFVDRAARG